MADSRLVGNHCGIVRDVPVRLNVQSIRGWNRRIHVQLSRQPRPPVAARPGRSKASVRATRGNLPDDTARVVLHSHPGEISAIRLGVSGDDVNALARLALVRDRTTPQWSLIVNSEGTVARFGASGEPVILKQFVFGQWRYPIQP